MMFKSVVKIIKNGAFAVYKCTTKEDEIWWVPDDNANRHRQEIDQFVADGETITEEEI